MDASRLSNIAKRSWRLLRTVAAWVFVALSLLLIALWVESYRVKTTIGGRHFPEAAWHFGIARGVVSTGFVNTSILSLGNFPDLFVARRPVSDPSSAGYLREGHSGFYWDRTPGLFRIYLPHWFLVLVSAAIAVALRPKPRLRFGLRDLLILTLLVAVIFGGVEAVSRAYQEPYATGSAIAR